MLGKLGASFFLLKLTPLSPIPSVFAQELLFLTPKISISPGLSPETFSKTMASESSLLKLIPLELENVWFGLLLNPFEGKSQEVEPKATTYTSLLAKVPVSALLLEALELPLL